MWKQEQLEVAVKDVSFVIDNVPALDAQESLPFYGRLDVSKIGVCGHSAGGALAMRMCFEDNRIMAGISLDGSIRGNESLTTFTTPFLLILAEKSHVHKGAEGLQGLAKYNQLCHKPHMQMSIMTFRGVGHTVFSDLPLLLHATMLTRLLSYVIPVDINTSSAHACRALDRARSYIVSFFDQHLKGRSIPLFAQPKCDIVVDIE